MSEEKFSDRHPFSQAEVQHAVEMTAAEDPRRRLLLNVTTAHRQNSIDQWASNQFAYWMVVPALFLSELARPTVSRPALYLWLALAVASWGARALMYFMVFRAPPAEVSRSLPLRMVPLGITAISLSFWAWSAVLFVTGAATPTLVVLYVGFVFLSIGIAGNLLTAPIPAGVMLVGIWLALSARTVYTGSMPWFTVAIIDCAVAGTLWLSIYSTIKRIKPHLDRSDQVDLLLAEHSRANAELELMKNEAAATLAKRSAFFAGASHDFRQRLHAMKVMTLSAVAGFPQGDRSRWALTRVSEEMGDLDDYITRFLEFTRSEAMDEAPVLQDVELLVLFQQVELRFEDIARTRGVQLKYRVPKFWVRADRWLLLQMIENLVSNAAKFTRHRVLVAARRRAGSIVVEVWDQGAGIHSDELSRVFDAFHQDPRAAFKGERGVGLGLAIAKRFADRLGFTVTVDSRLGKGSVFRIEIPPNRVVSR